MSIQSMIFNSQPWYNEPGREMYVDQNQSDIYNKSTWQHTVRHAILYWLNERLAPPDTSKGKAVSRRAPTTTATTKQANPPVVATPLFGFLPGQAKTKPTPSADGATKSTNTTPNHFGDFFPPAPPPAELLQQMQMMVADLDNQGINLIHMPMPPLPPGGLNPAAWSVPVPDVGPIGNTVVDSKDDYVWGTIVRKHFALKAGMVVAVASKKGSLGVKSAKELEEAFKQHGFLR